MQLINAPGKLVLPFANAGAKNSIPVASQIGITAGAASLTDGFPPLTRTPLAAGGTPPSGLDMNGIIYELSAILRWANAGAGYVYDGTFAADSNVGGYPKGARVLRSDGLGYWFNTTDNNTTDPEGAGAVAAGWVPDFTNGAAAVTMTNANVTLTPLQWGKPIIVITGLLTGNLNLVFPNIVGEWLVVNSCTGAHTVTCKTAAGTGVVVTPGLCRIVYSDASNVAAVDTESTTPAQFDNSTKVATTAYADRNLMNKNTLINGRFDLWQRGVNFAPSGQIYTADHWYSYNTGATATVSRVAAVNPTAIYGAKLQRTAAATNVNIIYFGQPYETAYIIPLRGQYVTLSFSAKAGANFSAASSQILVGLTAGTGVQSSLWAGFTGNTTPINSVAQAITTTMTRYSITSSIPLAANASQLEAFFKIVPVGTAGADDSVTIEEVQLEVGNLATVFDSRPLGTELNLCERYYEKSFPLATTPAQNTGSTLGAFYFMATSSTTYNWLPFRTRKMAVPTIVTYNPNAANVNVRDVTASVDRTVNVGSPSESGIAQIGATGCTVTNSNYVHWTAESEL